MPFYKIITNDDGNADVDFVYATTLRRAVTSLTSLDTRYQSFDNVDKMSDEQLEMTYKKGYLSQDKSLFVQIYVIKYIPILNVENGLIDKIELKVPKKPIKSTVWKDFLSH